MKTGLINNLLVLTLVWIVLSLATPRNASGDVLVDANLIAYWQFSGDAEDSSGYDNDGTLAGNATVSDDILTLDGDGDYVNCGDVDVDVNSSFTLSLWLRPAATGEDQAILIKGDGQYPGDDSYGLYYVSDDTFCFYVSEDGGWENCAYVNTVNTYSGIYEWYHVVATFDGTDLAIYVDGTHDTGCQTGSVSGAVDNDIDTLIGARVEGAGTIDHFYGDIDEVMIYTRALEDWEVRKLYNKTNKNYAHFDEIMAFCIHGPGSIDSGYGASDIGFGNTVSGYAAAAIGTVCTASGLHSKSIGIVAEALNDYGIALGRFTTNNTANSLTIGYGSPGAGNHRVDFRVQSGQVNVYGDLDVDETVTASEVVTTDKLVLPVKTTTGDPASPVEGQIYVNTYDNKVRVYADGAWRDLATW